MELLRLSFLTKKGFSRTGGSGRDLSFQISTPPIELLRLSFLTKTGFNRTGGSGRDLSFDMDKAGFVKFC